MPKQLSVALIGVLVFGLIAVGGVADQYRTSVSESQPAQVVENETFTADNGTVHTLAESKRDVVYNRSVAVYQGGTLYEGEGNYTWNAGNGTIFVPNSSSLTDGSDADITYRYHVPDGSQQVTRDVVLLPFQLGEGLGIVIGAALLLAGMVLLGRQR